MLCGINRINLHKTDTISLVHLWCNLYFCSTGKLHCNEQQSIFTALLTVALYTNNNLAIDTKTPTKKMSAFTLIELLVALCVLAILLVIAMPSFHIMLLNSRLTANTDALVSALNYARSTALNQSVSVQVCPLGTLNSATCGTNWADGWTIITQPATGSPVLLKSQQSTDLDPVISANVSSVVFDTHGLATTQSNFTLCDTRGGSAARSLEVMATGYVQSGTTPGQAVWDNSTLSCP